MYTVKEIFLTVQGEGANTGRSAVFCRFSGCNLWSGRESDRATAICQFCDTDFLGVGPDGGKFDSAEHLSSAIEARWQAASREDRFVVCTGGEPLLQVDAALIEALHSRGFAIAVETNGTIAAPANLDWICVSPKAGAPLVQREGDELKLVFPQAEAQPDRFESLAFEHLFLQPMDGPQRAENTKAAVRYCLDHPRWRLSVQTHKALQLR